MVKQFVVLSLLALLALADDQPIPGSDELLFGFDAVKGITLAQLVTLTYNQSRSWFHPLRPSAKFAVPDQIQVHQDAIEDISDSFEDTLEQWIQTKATTLGLPSGYLGFFGLSVEYDHVQEQYVTEMHSFHERRELLGYMQLTPVPGTYVATALMEAAANLPATCNTQGDMATYIDFLKKWGTHYINFVRMGGYMHQTAEFASSIFEKIDKTTITTEVNAAWQGFTAGASAKHNFENDQYSQTNHTTVHFLIDGGNIYRKFEDMQDWKDTVPDNPATIARNLAPIADLVGSAANGKCLDAATRGYYAANIKPKSVMSSKINTVDRQWTDNPLKVMNGYLTTGISIDFGGTCIEKCLDDGPQTNMIAMISKNFFGLYAKGEPQTLVVQGARPREWKNVIYECPENTFLAGLSMAWAGTCKAKCDVDGAVLAGLDLVCRTPHVSDAPRLLSDAKPGAVPLVKIVPIHDGFLNVTAAECPSDFLVESLTIKLKGTCYHKCDKDGSSIMEIGLNCRALKDFTYA